MKNFFNKIKSYALAHKVISAIIILIVLGGGYFAYAKFTATAGDTRYVISKVERDNIIASVSGTGQVSAESQIDLKPKGSGTIVSVPAHNGEKVATGAIIMELDTTDAEKSVRDAETALDSANLALQKIQIEDSGQNTSADLTKTYSDSLGTVSSTFSDLNSIANGLNNILGETRLSDNATREAGNGALDYRNKAIDASNTLANDLFQSSKDYAKISSSSSGSDIENIIQETYNTTKDLANAVKATSDFVDFMSKDTGDASVFTPYQNTLSTYTSTTNGDLSGLLAAQTNISNTKDSTQNSSLDIQNAQLSVTEKENALQDAKDNLEDYIVRAPFSGTVTNITLKKGDTASSGTAVATLITNDQVAEVSMNEVDVAKIKLGEKATLTFDAVPDLTISGVVSEIDSIGTVSQGVVTYNVKISFDTQDARVLPSMSVSATIITDVKQNVIAVPNGAIKSQNGTSYVEMFSTPLPAPTDGLIGSISKVAPNKIPVETGLSNDSETEITSGLNEGDEIVTRTILPTAAKTTAAPSLFSTTGSGAARTTGAAAGGGAARAGGGAAAFGR